MSVNPSFIRNPSAERMRRKSPAHANRELEAALQMPFTNDRVKVNSRDRNGRTPLSRAAGKACPEEVRLFPAKGKGVVKIPNDKA